MSLEALFCTLIIYSHKIRNVATFNVPGAYLHAEIPEDKSILMQLRGGFVNIMLQVNPEYKQYVRYEYVKICNTS